MSILSEELPAFYLPENPEYPILASAAHAASYTVAATTPSGIGANAHSFLVDINAKPVRTNGRHTNRQDFADTAREIARHAIHSGYLDDPEIPVRLYRDAESGEFFDQVEARRTFFDLGHMAKAIQNLVDLAGNVDAGSRERLMIAGRRFGAFVLKTGRTASGWLPRRVAHDLSPYMLARVPPPKPGVVPVAGGPRPDPIAERSGAGLLTVACMLKLDRLGLVKGREFLRETCDAFIDSGGYFGSVNTDTEDQAESVAFALAFQTLLEASDYLECPGYRNFAFDVCLPGLERFHMVEDRNGQRTKGLLRLSDSYSSACMWECSEAALAYFRAAADRGRPEHALAGLTILRAIARNHFGELGFIPSELDWNGRMPPEAHLEAGPFGPRRVTHPYMNNLHVVRSTLFFLENLAGGFDEKAALASVARAGRLS